MSGGHFNYTQYYLNDILDEIKNIIKDNPYQYSSKTIKKMKETVKTIEKAKIYITRIDYLISGDDGEDTFHKRIKEDIKNI